MILPEKQHVPLGVKLIITYYVLTALVFPILLHMELGSTIPSELLGMAGLSGLIEAMVGIATVIMIIYTLILIYGLWHLKKWAWWLIVIFSTLGLLIQVASWSLSWTTGITLLMTTGITLLILGYLIWVRKTFGSKEPFR